LEEFAQLLRSDIRDEDGIWHFDINDEDEKQIKNAQSARRVPLHPKILALGFLDYVEQTTKTPTDRVFPQLKPGGPDRKFGYYFTKWWTRYRRDVGLYERGLDYHSFRHGVTTKLYGADEADAVVDMLTGHEGAGTSRRVYLKELPLRRLCDAISKVDWPELSSLPHFAKG
jgi:integrase